MIEKLDIKNGGVEDLLNCIKKINEVIDVVNEIMTWQFETDDEPAETPTISKKENVDPYAEQRKWIGKLCRFWNDDESLEDSMYGELVNIFDAPHEDCPFQCGYGEWYEHCEPVSPDDDIIYKGGDNE